MEYASYPIKVPNIYDNLFNKVKNYKYVHIYFYPTTDRQSCGSKVVGTECRLTHVRGLKFEPGYCTVAYFVFNIQNDVVLYQIWQIWFNAASFVISITNNN